MDEISIEDFIKIDMRVAEIKNAENVEEADKLLKIISRPRRFRRKNSICRY